MDAFSQAGFNPKNTNNLRSLKTLQQLNEDPSSVSMTDIIGLVGGGALGLYVSTKFPNAIVKYIGIIVGAELGIAIARVLRHE